MINDILAILQILMTGAIFIHSACVLSRHQFKGWLNPVWLGHVCFVAYAMQTGINIYQNPYVFDFTLAAISLGFLLLLIGDYVQYRKTGSSGLCS